MRKEMSLIAAHAAWHMGQWDEMAVYVDTVDSGPGGSSNTAGMGGLSTSSSFHLAQHGGNGSVGSVANSIMAAAAAASTGGSSVMNGHIGSGGGSTFTTGMGGRVGRLLSFTNDEGLRAAVAVGAGAGGMPGGPMSSTGAFLRAVLCIKHNQHDLARVNVERSRGERQSAAAASQSTLAHAECSTWCCTLQVRLTSTESCSIWLCLRVSMPSSSCPLRTHTLLGQRQVQHTHL